MALGRFCIAMIWLNRSQNWTFQLHKMNEQTTSLHRSLL